MSPIEAVTFKD